MKSFITSLLSAAFFLLSLAMPAHADDSQILNVDVKERSGSILVSADLEKVFSEEVQEALLSGMPVTFTYYLNLRKARSFIWDKKVKKVTVHKVVKYDSFAKEFNGIEVIAEDRPNSDEFEKELAAIKDKNMETLFSKDAEPNPEWNKRYLILKNMSALMDWMSHLRDVPVGDTFSVMKDRKYYVEVKAEMNSPEITAPFNYILFFISFLEFETDWENSSAFAVKKPGAPLDRMFGNNK